MRACLNRVMLLGHGKLSSLFRGGLQQVERSVKNGVFRRKRARSEPGFFLGLGCCSWWRCFFIGRVRIFFRGRAHYFRWDDAFFHDRFAAGIVVVRDREDQRRAIIQRNKLLLGGETKSPLSNDIPAMVRSDGGSQNFRGSGRGGVDQNGDGIPPNYLLGLGRKKLRRDGLAAQRRQGARRNEKASGRNRLGDLPASAFPHIHYDLAYSLFFRIQETIANFIRAACVERGNAQHQNVGIHFLGDDLRRSQLLSNDIDFFRRSLAAPDYPNLDSRARLAIEKIHGLAHGHVASGKSADGFENVAAANSRFGARTIRQHGENDDVTVALAERQPGLRRACIRELLLVLVVFAGREVAGLRVQGFQHPVQGTGGPRPHVGMVDVILLDFLQDFTVNGERLVGFVVGRAAQDVPNAGVTTDGYRYEKNSNASRSVHAPPFHKKLQSKSIPLPRIGSLWQSKRTPQEGEWSSKVSWDETRGNRQML